MVGHGESLGNGLDQRICAGNRALLHEGGKTADEVNAECLCGSFQRLCQAHVARGRKCSAHVGDRRHGDALVDNRNAVRMLKLLANANEILCLGGDLVIDLRLQARGIVGDTIEQRDSHRNRTDIEVFLADHFYGL